jgi:hypothetical protein
MSPAEASRGLSSDTNKWPTKKRSPEPPAIATPLADVIKDEAKSRLLDNTVFRGDLRTVSEGMTLPIHAYNVADTGRVSNAPVEELGVTYTADKMLEHLPDLEKKFPKVTRLLSDIYKKSGQLADKAFVQSGLSDIIYPALRNPTIKRVANLAGRSTPYILAGQIAADGAHYYAQNLNTRSANNVLTPEQRLHQTHKTLKTFEDTDNEAYERLKAVYERLVEEDINNRRIFEGRPYLTLDEIEDEYPHVYDK